MTDHPERDPDIQRAVDTAARELARRIRANPAPADPDALAAGFVEDMYTEGWRPIPRPALVITQGPRDPAAAHRGAALVREALTNARRSETE